MARSKKTTEIVEEKVIAPKSKTMLKASLAKPKAVAKKASAKTTVTKPKSASKTSAAPTKKSDTKKTPAEPQKPGLVSMAPATKAKATRKSTVITAAKRANDKKGKNDRVAVVQQEQIMADDLHAKVVSTPEAEELAPVRAKTPKKTATAPTTVAPRAQAVSSPPAVTKAQRRRKLRLAAISLTIFLAVIAGAFMFTNHRHQVAATADAKLIQAVSARVVVPANESPSISTVVDAKSVNQAFLAGAKDGDKVLLYFQSGRAIVYRPSTGQIVNMGPLQEPQPRVMIRKGSASSDISKVGAEIAGSNAFTVTSRDDSPNMNYAKTIVIDVVGNRPDVASKLAQLLHATVASLPQGETRPDADLLVIVGSDTQ